MKIWYVEAGWEYDTNIILGIFSTEQKAINCQEAAQNSGLASYDYVCIYEMEIE